MEGCPQLLKLLKWLQRRGFADGKGVLVSEFRDMRIKYGITREEIASWAKTSADVLAQLETLNLNQYIDGGLHRELILLVKQLTSRHASEEVETPVDSSDLILPMLPAVTEPLLEPVEPVEAVVVLSASDNRILASMRGLDYSDPQLATNDQRFQRFCEFWVTEKKIKRFSIKRGMGGMLIPAALRDAVLEITGGTPPQFLANWRLYRHVKAKSKHKMALDSVRAGYVSAVSALMDYDERGPAARGPKNKGGKKKPNKKARRKSDTSALRALSESNARLMSIPKVKLVGKKKAQAQFKGAQAVQEAVGALKLRLAALKVDLSGDQRLLTLIEGITQAVDPTHLKLKQLVLRRATKSRSK